MAAIIIVCSTSVTPFADQTTDGTTLVCSSRHQVFECFPAEAQDPLDEDEQIVGPCPYTLGQADDGHRTRVFHPPKMSITRGLKPPQKGWLFLFVVKKFIFGPNIALKVRRHLQEFFR